MLVSRFWNINCFVSVALLCCSVVACKSTEGAENKEKLAKIEQSKNSDKSQNSENGENSDSSDSSETAENKNDVDHKNVGDAKASGKEKFGKGSIVVGDSRTSKSQKTETFASTKTELASLRAEIQSLSERLRTTERNLEALQRTVRSGIWEQPNQAAQTPQNQNQSQNQSQNQNQNQNQSQSQIQSQSDFDVPQQEQTDRSVVESYSGPTRALISQKRSPRENNLRESDAHETGASSSKSDDGLAIRRLASAEMKMTAGQFSEALSLISEVEREFPNLNDGGKTFLLSAECNVQLQKPEAAIPTLRRFYLKFPRSPEILAAKLIEARAQLAQGASERAIAIYREVISLGPRTGYAQTARTALQKLRDER